MNRPAVAAVLALVLSLGFLVFALVTSRPPSRPTATATVGVLADPGQTYDPFRAGEALPDGYRQLLRRDAILPVYEPVFIDAAASNWSDDTLVIGVALDGEAKAYPVAHLNSREMVIDRVAGIPVLVSW